VILKHQKDFSHTRIFQLIKCTVKILKKKSGLTACQKNINGSRIRAMKNFRHLLRDRSLLTLLAMAVVLRSLIAPGFMLEASADAPFGLTVTLCEGLGGIDQIDGMSAMNGHADHSQHAGHDMPEDSTSHSGMDHSKPSAGCAALAVSSAYIEIPHDVSAQLGLLVTETIRPDLFPAFTHNIYSQPQQPRAPPVTLTI